MPLPRPLPCAFYRTAAGNEPVREWLKELPDGERKQVGCDVKAVQYGWPLGLPLVDSLGEGLWEVRCGCPPESPEPYSSCTTEALSSCMALSRRPARPQITNSI